MSSQTNHSRSPDLLNNDISHTLYKMTLPMIVGMVMLMTFGLVDTFFIGMIGTQELAAISFTFPVTFTVISLNIGLGIGTSAVIARIVGAGDSIKAKETATGALMLTLVLAVSLAVLGVLTIEPIFKLLGADAALLVLIHDYMVVWYLAGLFLALPMVGNSVLRASGDTKTPSLVMAFGGFVNAILDPILIFGWGPVPALGIQGAAIATLIAWAVSLFYILYLLAIKRKLMGPRLLNWHEFRRSSGGILKIGLPAAGANMLTPIATGIVTAIVATYGHSAVAAWGVGGRLESIAMIVVLALSMSLPPFISQNYGANKLDRVNQAYSLCVKFVLAWQLLMFVIVALLSQFIAVIFSNEKEVSDTIVLFLLMVPLGYGLQGVTILTNSSFNAMHMPMSALVLNALRLFVFVVPISYVGSLWFDLTGIFIGTVVANLLVGCIAVYWCKKVLNRKFNLTKVSH
ncbi:MATE family efflux transporter [Paraglaciecola aquimarina]|uniref:MATE family efflux transporter n=1 Tax=Paraglaciecola aquimarina TaxID=1235557 RepID=A0ABU3T1L3_9ALTE|nr:MATE family efflux transporter [Paraglaciecola aquimarina]MDU0356170.1 MATE family efflux transporter [Paraglaciecola aquimarina]